MKSITFIVVFLLLGIQGFSQEKTYDAKAVNLLDRMAAFIGDLHSCSLHINTSTDEADITYGTATEMAEADVYISGRHNLYMLVENKRGTEGYWYNGDSLKYYSFTRNHFGVYESDSSTTLGVISDIHENYGVNFPSADFFYPTFTDDLIDFSNTIKYVGTSKVNGQSCFKIIASKINWSMQLWLSDSGITLPVKMIVINTGDEPLRYEASYSEWKLNPDLPNALFDFKIPEDANPLLILSKNSAN